MTRYIIFLLYLLLMLMQSCVVYQESPISITEAVRKGRVKVIMHNAEELLYKKVFIEDSIFYGYNARKVKNDEGIYEWETETIPLVPELVDRVYLKSARNVIFGTFGGAPYHRAASMYYERILGQKAITSFVRGGFGSAVMDKTLMFQVGALTGKKVSHFEAALGGVLVKEHSHDTAVSEKSTVKFSGSIGYRYQRPRGGVMFRAGFSLPEAFYIGLGINF